MRILVIDDDEDVRMLLAHYLRQEWPEVEVELFDPLTHDLSEALARLPSCDAVILDYLLGRGDGLQWLREFKRRPDCPPVVFLTGAGNEVVAVRAMKAGADDYQRKQELSRERLTTSLRDLMGGKLDKTVPPGVAARMEAHALGSRLHIPGIRVLRLIGEGGMSRVYLASRVADDEPLVVKVLRPEVMADASLLQRFLDEYRTIQRIRSRHVARIEGHGVSHGNAYLVMEFFEGGDLSRRLAGRPLEPAEALRIFRQLMYALGDIHEHGVLHRDLKPQNLMFRADGSLAIVDFGIAKHVDAIDSTRHGEILGTPRYMSPEQVRGLALDLRTDIYSAGVLLYQMLAGRHLYEGETAIEVALHHLNTPPPPLPPGLEAYQPLLDRLLEKDRDARFRNADEVIGYLSRKYEQAASAAAADTTQPLH